MCKFQLTVIILLLPFITFGQFSEENLSVFQKMPQSQQIDEVNKAITSIDSAEIVNSGLLFHWKEKLKVSKSRKEILEVQNRINAYHIKDSINKATLRDMIKIVKLTYHGFNVNVYGVDIVTFYSGYGILNAEDRANELVKKLERIASHTDYDLANLKFQKIKFKYYLVYNTDLLCEINISDAYWNEVSIDELAKNVQKSTLHTIQKHQSDYSNINLLIQSAIFIALIVAIVLLYRWVGLFVTIYERKLVIKIHQIHEQTGKLSFFDSPQLNWFIQKATAIVRVLIVFTIVYFSLPFVFNLFPWTESWAAVLYEWSITPLKKVLSAVVRYIPNLLTILVIYGFGRMLVKILHYLAQEIDKGKFVLKSFYADWAIPTFHILRFIVYALVFIAIFPYLPGSNSPVFQGVSVFLGLLLSVGSSSAVSNIVSGMVITYMRPFKIGDMIKIGEVSGKVLEKNMLVTRIITIKNESITIPNSSVLSSYTLNYTTESQIEGLILNTTVTIGYDAPWRQVHQLLIDAALATNGVLKDKKPFVLQTSLDDFYVSYQINAYTLIPDHKADIYSELNQHIQDKFNEAGVEIMSPHYASLRDGNTATIPSQYVDKQGDSAFKVNINSKP